MQPLIKEIPDLKISLLFSDPVKAQNISKELRKFGVLAHYFHNIHDFWTNCLHQSVDILIVDNAELEKGGVSLKDHPRIRNRQVSVIVSSEEPVLLRTDLLTEMRCVGFINPKDDYLKQLDILLNSVLHFEVLKLERAKLLEHRERLRMRNQELHDGFENSKQFAEEFLFIQQIVEVLDTKLEMGFLNALDEIFLRLNFVKKYAIFGINASKTQVVSLHKRNAKTSDYTNLWESDSLEDGLKDSICERILKHGQDILGGDIVPLKIQGHKNHAEFYLLLSVEDKGSRLFPWKTLEEQMSFRYLKSLAPNQRDTESKNQKNSWQLLSYIDDFHYHYARAPKSMIEINFSEIVTLATTHKNQRFFWENFRLDFEKEVTKYLGSDIEVIDYGVEKIIILVDQENISTSITMLEDLVEFFEFWRYFENTSLVLSHKIVPSVNLLAMNTQQVIANQPVKEEKETLPVSSAQNLSDYIFEWDGGHAQ